VSRGPQGQSKKYSRPEAGGLLSGNASPERAGRKKRPVMSAESEVRDASARFYAALNSMMGGDAAPIVDAWSHGADVTTMHPIGGREVGWDEVRGSFEQVAGLASGGQAELRDQRIVVSGDMAYEVGVEYGQAKLAGEQISIEQRVTNVYRREAGGWKIVHHHTDISPAMLDMLSRLRAA
jgi:ketosteroid isomerase-like protein